MPAPMIAHKFGGTSVADAARIRHVAGLLIARTGERQVVVVSAMKGVTDALISLCRRAAALDEGWVAELGVLLDRHQRAAQELVGEALRDEFDRAFAALGALLRAQAAIGAVSGDLLELISGLGEIWSSRLLHEHLRLRGATSEWLDARDILVVEKDALGAHVDWARSQARLAELSCGRELERLIVPGFVARDQAGRVTTLGCNGSDYSGAIFGALCDAREIHIWTDVDGVLSADPREVPEAVQLARMSYSEACELAYFGAKVIHPQTMAPAIQRGIPIVIRNTFSPEQAGTRIDAKGDLAQPIKGVTTFSALALLNIEGAGMIGVPGTAERAFGALREAGISVVMISQGSSEHSICCVLDEARADDARDRLLAVFSREVAAGQLVNVTAERGISALAVVGDGMTGSPGVAARLFSALARARVNVRAIAQGASERNISVAIRSSDAPRALRAVHAGFYLSPLTISVGLLGAGNVGAALLRQLSAARTRLLADHGVDLRVRAVATSRSMWLADPRLEVDPELVLAELRAGSLPALELEELIAHVHASHLPHAVLIDCTASDAIAERYAGLLARGVHVLSANKQAGSGPWPRYEAIRQAGQGTVRFRYEATVGAGLPIIQTLRDLLDTGDEILAIDGIFSGTLAYIFNLYDGSRPFSALVREARARGYTEPDPRDDLSGLDVARKLVILAREVGLRISLDEVVLESLVPPGLRAASPAEFLDRLQELDGPMAEQLVAARAQAGVLRYVARLEAGGRARVGLTVLPASHAFSHIRLTDNVVQFTSRRYRENPLVIQGPGAGPEVTAAGVFADLLRIVASLGARL